MYETVREYKMGRAGRLLCSGLFLLCAAILVLASVFRVYFEYVQRDPWAESYDDGALVDILVIVAALALGPAYALLWRMRIDGRGVSRRRLFVWDMWTWEELESGRIDKPSAGTLRDPSRPWWRRTLSLAWLSARDQMEALSLINSRYSLPPAPEPETPIRVLLQPRKVVVFDRDSIVLRERGKTHTYAWTDVQRARFLLSDDPLSHGYKEVRLILPDTDIEVTRFENFRQRNGLRTLVLRNIPRERIRERPMTERRRVAKRLRARVNEQRSMRWCFLAMILLSIAGALVSAFGEGPCTGYESAIAFSVVMGLMIGLGAWGLMNETRRMRDAVLPPRSARGAGDGRRA